MERDHIQQFIEKTDSLIQIAYIVRTRTPSVKDVSIFKVNKIFSKSSNFLSLKLSNPYNAINFDDSNIEDNPVNGVSLHQIKKDITSDKAMNREHQNFVGFNINDDTKDWNEESKVFISKKYASLAAFLHEHFPSAKRLKFFMTQINDSSFLMYLLEQLDSDKIEMLGTFHLFDVLKYSMFHCLFESNIFKKLPNLKNVTMDIRTNDYFDVYENYESTLQMFLNCLCVNNKNIKLELLVEDSSKTMDIAFQILDYSKKINLEVYLNGKSIEWNGDMMTPAFNLTEEGENFFENIETLDVTIERVEDIKKLDIIVNKASKLKDLSIFFERILFKNIVDKYSNNIPEICKYIKETFNFVSSITKLNKLKIALLQLPDNVNDDVKVCNEIYSYFWDSLLSIFPSTIRFIILKGMEKLTTSFFNHLSINCPSLGAISIVSIFDVPVNAFNRLYKLRDVIIHGEVQINIPRWINVVCFCYFEYEESNEYNIISDNISNEHYFKLMNTSFDNSLRNVKEDNIYYIMFLKSILYWRNTMELLDECT